MTLLNKIGTSVDLIKENGLKAFFVIFAQRFHLPFPISAKLRWEAGIQSEIRFWDKWFRTKGLRWPESYASKLNRHLELQLRPASLLPAGQENVKILDVGAGPLTILGKEYKGRKLSIIAIDPLADQYDKLLDKYQIQPFVRTQKLEAEKLKESFKENTFDLVFANNSIDHTYNPKLAIINMLYVVKHNSYILLEHAINEAEKEDYSGFHQWNFSVDENSNFIISSKGQRLNINKEYKELCSTDCEVMNGSTLIVRMKKK